MTAALLNRARSLFGRPEPAAEPVGKGAQPAGRKPAKVFHAVSIVAGPRCCAAAKRLEGQRFLSKDAPTLPLAECGRTDCTCRYQHYDDRRDRARRARDMGVAVDGWVEEDRRTAPKRGRRKADAV